MVTLQPPFTLNELQFGNTHTVHLKEISSSYYHIIVRFSNFLLRLIFGSFDKVLYPYKCLTLGSE
jgi:hypothetical protein